MKEDLGQLLDLRDIHAPLPPSIWPPAPGWWLLAALLLVVLVLVTRWALRRWQHARLRRRVLQQLQQMEPDDRGLVACVSMLLKQVALARYPQEQVAALNGQAWLEFLDRTGATDRFQHGPGQVLAQGPYSAEPAEQPQELIRLGSAWVRKNL